MCKIGNKYQYVSGAVCASVLAFRKRLWCALIGACALIRTNSVYDCLDHLHLDNAQQSTLQASM